MGAVEERWALIGLTFERPLGTVACFGAHADDIEIGAAASLAIIAATNPDCSFVFAIATGHGERVAEAEASAAKLLGDRVTVVMGDFSDGFLPYDRPAEAKTFFRSAVGGIDPDLVFSPALGDRHQDHRFVADLAHQILRDHAILQYEIHKSDGDLARPVVYVPLSADQAHAKIDHLDGHFASQQDKPWFDREALLGLLRLRGVECRAPDGYAEGFHADRIVLR